MQKIDNSKKIILDLCGGTASWSKPYKDAGYNVKLITLPDYDVCRVCFEKNKLFFYPPLKTAYASLIIKYKDIYGILAAPPCTMFSLARQNAKTPRDFREGMKTVRACMDIIWACKENYNLKFWALENPTGYLRQFLGKPAFNFQPYEFGDKSKKRTDIWGYFKEPKKKPIKKPDYPSKGAGCWQGKSKTKRSITPPGFAKAFFNSNK